MRREKRPWNLYEIASPHRRFREPGGACRSGGQAAVPVLFLHVTHPVAEGVRHAHDPHAGPLTAVGRSRPPASPAGGGFPPPYAPGWGAPPPPPLWGGGRERGGAAAGGRRPVAWP